MRALIALAGPGIFSDDRPDSPAAVWLRRAAESADWIVAADGGLAHLRRLSIPPHVYLGDRDSSDAADWAWGQAHGMSVRLFDRQKNQTDGELAMRFALEQGCDSALVMASFAAARPDHVLANLLLLGCLSESFSAGVRVTDGAAVGFFLSGPADLRISPADVPALTGDTVISLVPLGGDLTGVCYRGLAYPLSGALLPFGTTRGVSNLPADQTGTEIQVQIQSGRGVLWVTPSDQPDDRRPPAQPGSRP